MEEMNMKTRKYNFKRGLMKTIKKAGNKWYRSRFYVQVNYDKRTGDVWGDLCTSGNWHNYHDENIIFVGLFSGYYTRKDIVNFIEYAMMNKE